MSNELVISLDGYFQKGESPPWEVREFKKHTVSGEHNLTGQVQAVATGGTTLTKPTDCATPRFVFLKNIDDSNIVKYGDETSQPGYLDPRESVFTGWCATQVKCVASLATLDVVYGMWDKS